ncbi:MAG: hypothetical protein LKE37_10260 [Atopobiaceae bacterium]|jgi:hypothetical protein|nr:hypothetical protein [Atopobiaceae bacterium]
MAGTKQDAERFVAEWQGRGNEDQDTQLFWIDLMQGPLGLDDALRRLRFEVPTKTDADSDHEGYVDVLIPSAKVLVEQKSLGIDLDKPETRQGRPVTPVQQALGYSRGMRWEDKPRYLITCNFSAFRVYDLNKDPLCQGEPLTLELADLPRNVAALRFLDGGHAAPASLQQAVSEQAGAFMGHIHDLIAAKFKDPDSPGSHHALSVLCTRLMFLMFCEDSGLIDPDTFRDFLQAYNGSQLRQALLALFRWLDTPTEERDLDYAEDVLRPFPYTDGGLFSEAIEIPMLDDTIWNDLITTGCQEYDWSNVDPTVFGSIFEGALSHDARRAGGMHYTSPENIHKVIDPLFLDGLTQELDGILEEPAYNKRMAALERYHDKLGSLTFLDPACGSGNFLTETYVCLRRLENRVLSEERRMQQASDRKVSTGQGEWAFEASVESPVKVKPSHFHGIEINDFACCVARTALWIAEKQADTDTQKVISRVYDEFPLTDYETIVEGNALRMDWDEVVPASECDYVMGNPPFIGYSNLDKGQNEDRASIFGKVKVLDYVACWYKKASDYIHGMHARCAFVSTNSVCQGQQVEPLWRPLFEDGIHIDFAWPTFVWNSEATDEAHVHVVIVGFSREDVMPKRIYAADGVREVEHINAYLAPAGDAFVTRRAEPICRVPEMVAGANLHC